MTLRGFVARLWLAGMAALAFGPAQALPPAMPTPEQLDTLRARLLDTPVPVPEPGGVALRPASGIRGLKSAFRRTGAPPRWRDTAIVLTGGTHHLADIARAMPEPGWLDCAHARCTLAAPLVAERGTTLVIDGIDLVLGQDEGALILNRGHLIVSDSTLRAWHIASDTPAQTDDKGGPFRPFVAGYADSHTLIRRSDLRHLGHQSPMSYGLSWGTQNRAGKVTDHPSVDMIANRLTDIYFGFYSYDADGVNIIDNHIAESHVYGIDPHDDTRNMLIHGNYVYGSRRSHGIILSRRIHDTVVSDNVSAGNAKAGFFLDKACHDVLIIGNEAFHNKTEGLVLHEVTRVAVVGNRFHGNHASGIRLRASSAVFLDRNDVSGNGKHGLRAYDWNGSRRAPNAEEATQIEEMRLALSGNRFRMNARGACHLTGDARVTEGQPYLCPDAASRTPGPFNPSLAQSVATSRARFSPAAGNAP